MPQNMGHLAPHWAENRALSSYIDPTEISVAEVMGYLKGKSSIWFAQNVECKVRNFLGHKFSARSCSVSTVGEEMIRAYIRNQEMVNKQLDQMQLKLASS